MFDPFPLSDGYLLRPALASDRWRIRQLLRTFHRETAPRPSRSVLALRYSLLGGLIALCVHWLFVLGLPLFMAIGSQLLASLAVTIGISLLMAVLGFAISTEWTKFWVIEHEGRLVACAKLCQYTQYSVLYDVLVVAQWRGRGLGSALVYHLSQKALKPLYLAAYPDKIGFYARFGFVRADSSELTPIIRHDLGLRSQPATVALVLRE